MTVLAESRHPAEFILSEASGQRSRENITLASGAGVVAPGTVLGKVTATGKYIASAVGASDGSEVPAAINIYGADATAADAKVSAILRDAEVNGNCLTYHADRDQPAEKTAANEALKSLGVIVR
ncbi:head decoration protein [Aestuariivirga sp.]|uniref:head decoration protein n=1 Tax=Aestuariivirga sp. TaxID=2650926 RepID=UPI00391B101D